MELHNGDAAPSHVAGTDNFYVLTRYNQSAYYAMAVIELGAAVKAAIVRSGAKRVLVEKKANGAAIIEQLTAAMAAGEGSSRARLASAKRSPSVWPPSVNTTARRR